MKRKQRGFRLSVGHPRRYCMNAQHSPVNPPPLLVPVLRERDAQHALTIFAERRFCDHKDDLLIRAAERRTFLRAAGNRIAAWGPEDRVDPFEGESVQGAPNLSTATVCHAERFFLTVRQSNKRSARKTLAYSKRWDSHALMASVQTFIYNMVRKHETTGKTPAQLLGITAQRWTLEDVVTMTDEYLAAQDERAFELAFESKFSEQPTTRRTYKPTPKDKLLVPWYLDPDSGGPNPLVKKPGVRYDESANTGSL